MDNQGSNNFNNNQGGVAHDANFWNPNPGTQSQGFQFQSTQPQGFQAQGYQSQEALHSQSSQYQTSQSQAFQPQNFQPQNFQSLAQSNSFQTTPINNFQSSASANTNNLLNKDFNMMTDEEKKEAERIARAKNRVDLLKTIGLIVVSLLAVLFIGLFIWMTLKWSEASTNVQGKIDVAVAEAKNQLQAKLENEFAEKEQYPFLTFSGPADFGSLTFEYPKNWSVYIPDDASRGGEFNAYLNPGQVNVVSDTTIMALRVSIRTEQIDSVLEDYNRKVQDGEMTVASKVVNKVNVNVFTGKLDNDYQGIVCIFKIRDKTAILRTDSSNVFRENFEKILSTIRFNS
jgi:hypothetical protein cdiviTM7_01856